MDFIKSLCGWKAHSDKGSNQRRAYCRICLVLSVAILAEACAATWLKLDRSDLVLWAVAIVFFINAFYFFLWVVLFTPFRSSESFQVNPQRLLWDTIVSSLYMIFVFSIFYRLLGTDPAGNPLDNIYFSAVTFSTLGFGDFKPNPNAQFFAATQAILGNLHLGMIVGSTFAAIQQK